MTRGRWIRREEIRHEGSPPKLVALRGGPDNGEGQSGNEVPPNQVDNPRVEAGLCAEPDVKFTVIVSRGACAEAWQSPRS